MPKKKKSLFVRVTEDEKKHIENAAGTCGLSISEYLRKVSLGFVPKALPADTFFHMTEKLAQIYSLCQGKISAEAEQQIIDVIRELNKKFMLPDKERRK